MALRSAVNPRNDAFGGGTLTRAGQPTAVGGSFSGAGASGFPAPGIPAILSARNNQGSNVRIPYARVVPLHAKDALPVKDLALIGTGQKTAYEYDGLESGELAWCLGKQFPIQGIMYPQNVDFSVLATQMPLFPPGGIAGANPQRRAVGPDGAPLVPHLQPNGFGPDRMQRLAYTAWIESHFLTRAGRQSIDLKAFDPFSDTATAIDSELAYWGKHGAKGGDLFAMPDLAYAFQSPMEPGRKELQLPNGTAMPQGLFVMERGPFLRSIGTDHRAIEVQCDIGNAGGKTGNFVSKGMISRHVGSDLSQKGLEVLLKQNGVFNWVPDGICLSKYETGPNGQADAELDARASQLFNVAIQGPAITKTWTHDSKLACMPMDKVFICVVGDLSYRVSPDAGGARAASGVAAARDMTEQIKDRVRELDGARTRLSQADADLIAGGQYNLGAARARVGVNAVPGGGLGGAAVVVDNGVGAVPTRGDVPAASGAVPGSTAAFTAWVGQGGVYPTMAGGAAWDGVAAPLAPQRTGIRGYELTLDDFRRDPVTTTQVQVDLMKNYVERLWTAYLNTFGMGANPRREASTMLGDFDYNAAALRNGRIGVQQAQLSNLRLMRATSSFLSQYSHLQSRNLDDQKVDLRESRLGLPIDFTPTTPTAVGAGAPTLGGTGGASYILGAWCIGTVLDSAASRSVMNNTVRTAPASMALNIAVNVEWWNADKLYQHYQDKERYTVSPSTAVARGAAPAMTPFELEDAANIAALRLENGDGTVAQRDTRRGAPSAKYSMDLDVEYYPKDYATLGGNTFTATYDGRIAAGDTALQAKTAANAAVAAIGAAAVGALAPGATQRAQDLAYYGAINAYDPDGRPNQNTGNGFERGWGDL